MAKLEGKDEIIARIELALIQAKRIRDQSRNNVQQLAQLKDLLYDENNDILISQQTPTAKRHKENHDTAKKKDS